MRVAVHGQKGTLGRAAGGRERAAGAKAQPSPTSAGPGWRPGMLASGSVLSVSMSGSEVMSALV